MDIIPAPDFEESGTIFFTFVSPEEGRRLALGRAALSVSGQEAELGNVRVIWRQNVAGGYGSTGAVMTFEPETSNLFLTIGDFMEPESAQMPDLDRGKVLRFSLDSDFDLTDAAIVETWTLGHRNPYGLAFAPDGQLWMHEMGPRGGDELNLITRGENYGWPLVSEGRAYIGTPIPDHDTRPDFVAPEAYWTPVISPAGIDFYTGQEFPGWHGAALIGGLSSQSLIVVHFDAHGMPASSDRYDMGARIRDVEVSPDGAVYVLEDGNSGRLLQLRQAP